MSLAQGFKEIITYHMSLAQGLGSNFVLYVPSTRVQRDSCVPYVPGIRVYEGIPIRRCGSQKRRFLMEAYRCVRLDLRKKILCKNVQVCPVWFSEMILIVEAY